MKPINASTSFCGLIGNPVGHSFSPLIHNTLSEKLDIPLAYGAFCVKEGYLEDALKGGFGLGFKGFNVTVPYKQQVIPYLCGLDKSAERIGAVNTLVRTESGFFGFNTDMPGLYRALESEGIDPQGKSALLLGAGGAARACGHLLGEHGAKELIILNRSRERADELAEELRNFYPELNVSVYGLHEWERLPKKDYLCFQATSVGLYPATDDAPILAEGFYQNIAVGVDCIFNPGTTLFMKKVRANGGKAINGLKMLLFQAVLAYEHWTGVKVPEDIALSLIPMLEEALKEKKG